MLINDKTGRIINSTGPWGQLNYRYDVNDNLVSIYNTHIKNSVDNNLVFKYTNNRLVGLNNSNQSLGQSSFIYDSFGNIKADNGNRYLYGADGNLLTTSGTDYATYGYDVNNNRTIKTINNKNIVTFYSKSGQALYELDLDKNKQTKFIYFNGKRVAEDVTQGKEHTVHYYYNDYLGNPVAMADNTGKTIRILSFNSISR